jgi:hypothetical protein
MANDAISYLPTPEAFKEGGYEPEAALFAPEAGGIRVGQAIETARQVLSR